MGPVEKRAVSGCASSLTMSDKPRLVTAAAPALAICLLLAACGLLVRGEESPAVRAEAIPTNRLTADDPRWRDLVAGFARQPDTLAEFEERRFFPFRKEPVALAGEVRVSRTHGLSLSYTAPEKRVVILDAQGVLMRDASGQQVPPDRRAEAGNRALFHVLRMDFPALEREFDVFGQRRGAAWSLVLVPRDTGLRRAIGNIHVGGEEAQVRTVELRRSEKQHIDIAMKVVRAPANFSADEMKRYFR
jgi:hypothetical protein